MNKDQMTEIRRAIDALFTPAFLKANGLKSLQLESGRYGTGDFSFKLAGVVAGGLTREETTYEMERSYDKKLPPRRTPFTYKGSIYEIIGSKARGRITAVRTEDGRGFTFPRELIKALVGGTDTK